MFLQQARKNSSTCGTSVHSTNFPSHLGNTPVTSLQTLETPHMEHLGKSWLYMNMMQVFSHFIKRHANECIAELETGSDGSTWAKRKLPSETLKCFFHPCGLYHQPGRPVIPLTYNPCIIFHSDLFLGPYTWALYKSQRLLLENMSKA